MMAWYRRQLKTNFSRQLNRHRRWLHHPDHATKHKTARKHRVDEPPKISQVSLPDIFNVKSKTIADAACSS